MDHEREPGPDAWEVLHTFRGSLTGVYDEDELEALRNEWDRFDDGEP